MQTDPSQQPQDPNAQQFVAGAEFQLPAPAEAALQTPEEIAGLTNGNFSVLRSGNKIQQGGWGVYEVGTDVDPDTGQNRQYVRVARLNDQGQIELSEDGLPVASKRPWLDDLKKIQPPEVDASSEAEAVSAFKALGAPAVHIEAQVELLDTTPSEDTMPRTEAEHLRAEDATQQEQLTTQNEAEANTAESAQTTEFGDEQIEQEIDNLADQLNAIHSFDGQNNIRADENIEQITYKLLEKLRELPAELQRAYQGVILGSLRSPQAITDYYSRSVRPGLISSGDKSAISYVDSSIKTYTEMLKDVRTGNGPIGYRPAKNRFGTSVASVLASMKRSNSIQDPVNKELVVLLEGVFAGISELPKDRLSSLSTIEQILKG